MYFDLVCADFYSYPIFQTDGHITQEILKTALESLDTSSLKSFVCGPPPMIEKINEHLLACGLLQNQVIYEKWW